MMTASMTGRDRNTWTIAVAFVFLLSCQAVNAAEPATTFTHLGAEDGLPSPTVWAIAQDPQGFMWFATSSGLARYDGIEMVVYRHDPQNSRSLVHDDLSGLLVDRAGTLWIGTAAGLSRYDSSTDSFDRFTHDPNNPNSLAGNLVTALAEGQDGEIWVGANGLNRLDPVSGRVTRYQHDPDKPASLSNNFIWAIHVDGPGRIWVGTNGDGLDRFNPASSLFEHIELGPELPSERNQLDDIVRAIHKDRSGALWVGTDGGLNRLDVTSGERQFFEHDYGEPAADDNIVDNIITAIFEDSVGNLWVGSGESGLNRYDQTTSGFIHYQADPADPNSLGSNLVTSVFEDRTGLLWFGGRGVSRLDLTSEQMLIHRPLPEQPAAAVATAPMSMLIDQQGLVWIANMNGMARLDRSTESWSAHLLVPAHPDYPDNRVYAMHDGSDGWFYVGVPQHIALFTRQYDSFGPTIIPMRNTPTFIYVDRSGTIWAGVPYQGLARLPGRDGDDQEYLLPHVDDPASISSDFAYFAHEDTRNRFWVGTLDGLNRLDRSTGNFERFMYDGSDDQGPSHKEFLAVAETADGDLWFGTGRGLNRLDANATQFQAYLESDGLAHDRVNAVAVDHFGNVWAGTDGGLSRLNPATGQIQNFYVQHGLPDNEILQLAIAPSGELYIGTQGGLVSLSPDKVVALGKAALIAVTGFEVFNAPASPSGDQGPRLSGPIGDASQLTLTHRDRVFSFDLAVLDYRDPEKNRYAYMLEGLDPDWIYTEGAQRRVSYTTLPAGRYQFLYKGADSSGRWGEATQAIQLTVLPAPWLTWWAYTLYATVAILAFVGLVILRTRTATNRASKLETTVRRRTRELRRQRDTIELQSQRLQDVAAAKDQLYANVSHEFRTPLTIILGPLERLLHREHSPSRRGHLETIRRSAQRLLRLVEQLLDLARLDAARVADPSPQPAGNRVHTLVQSFNTLAEDEGIQLTSRPAPAVWASCDADALDTIVVNLVSNAIKYTQRGGQIRVSVEPDDEDWITITVTDTGVGIPQDKQANIFERFYRADDQAEGTPGSGLGLALVKELVLANAGEIELRSEEDVGTSFAVRLPAAESETLSIAPAERLEQVEREVALLKPQQVLAQDEQGEAGASCRVLVIEDNQDLCRHFKEVLGDTMHCDFAHDGKSGLDFAVESVPDMIICDVMLPKLNGYEVTRQLKQDDRTCHIPVILLTARADEESRLRGLRTLADDYITKPFSEAELRQRVDTLLAVREILRQRYSKELDHPGLAEPLVALSQRDQKFIDRVKKTLSLHFSEPEFSTSEFASGVAMSERQLQRKLKALMNYTPREYLRNYRLQESAKMLRAGASVADTAYSVGFLSLSYFAKCFKAQFGVTPSDVLDSSDTEQAASDDVG
jgi:signal transduction histidine kinase/ligand-binding sensor domain-containing protein/DNA-binding response OmpR family regulator